MTILKIHLNKILQVGNKLIFLYIYIIILIVVLGVNRFFIVSILYINTQKLLQILNVVKLSKIIQLYKLSIKQRVVLFFWIQIALHSISKAFIFDLPLFPVRSAQPLNSLKLSIAHWFWKPYSGCYGRRKITRPKLNMV